MFDGVSEAFAVFARILWTDDRVLWTTVGNDGANESMLLIHIH